MDTSKTEHTPTAQSETQRSKAQRTAIIAVAVVALLALGLTAGYFLLPTMIDGDDHDHAGETTYYCPMHPQVTDDEPGVCPICHMDLVPQGDPNALEEHQAGGASVDGLQISPRDRVIADVATVEVDYRLMSGSIPAAANVEYNEAAHKVVTARFAGRIDRLFVNETGQYVRRGGPLAEIYSPDLITAQKEYLIALETNRMDVLPSIDGGARDRGDAGDRLVRSSRQRLKLLGMSDGQIANLESRGDVTYSTSLASTATGIVTNLLVAEGAYVTEGTTLMEVIDLSTVWVIANVPEAEIGSVRAGMRMTVTAPAFEGETLEGRIDYIYPIVDPESRTVQVRGVFANPGYRLKPGMYLTATLMKPSVDALAVPVTAVIRTGARDLVYVEVAENTFEAREVELGLKQDGYYQITLGDVHRGDKVVAQGGYLLDSERQLGEVGGHEH